MTGMTMLDRAGVLAATGHHPFARFACGRAGAVTGIGVPEAVFWIGETGSGRIGGGLGEAQPVRHLLRRARADGMLDGASWVNLPGRGSELVPGGFEIQEEWDFRWSTGEPSLQPFQDRVVRLADADAEAIDRLLDAAFPQSMLRPGSPLVRDWYGIWEAGSLVACAADRSTRSPDPAAVPVGVIGAVAVHPDHRRAGLGAAVTARLTRLLRRRHGLATLGVVAGNDAAARMYERLGFTGVQPLMAVRPRR